MIDAKLNQIRDSKTIERAFRYALFDRLNNDYYFDYFEMRYVFRNEKAIISELLEELEAPEKYIPRPAYAYYPPKTDLCYRRMIYIPFKDLVVRYAFVIIFAEYLDSELSPHCFANRRATGEKATDEFLKQFATETWPAFCHWQQESIEKYPVLLRTDISAFYDSISHDYLIQTIAKELSIDENSIVLNVFRSLLRVPVISYSQLSRTPQEPQVQRQGLTIGNGTEGFLANVYLKNVDEAMEKLPGIEFGRYNDDMRIFSHKREIALHAVLALQELLLTKGLNLNSSKTQIAENAEQLEELRSKIYQPSPSEGAQDEIEEEEARTQEIVTNNLAHEIDKPFDVFDRRFELNEPIQEHNDAKEFCKFLKDPELLSRSERRPEHMLTLGNILTQWQGNGKSASWLIIQSMFWKDIPQDTQRAAKKILFEVLQNQEVDAYSYYRLLHHLVKRRGKTPKYRYIDKLSNDEKQKIQAIVPSLLQKPAFELNLIGLYTLKVLGASHNKLSEYVQSRIQPVSFREKAKRSGE